MRRHAKASSATTNRVNAAGLTFLVVALLTLGLVPMAWAADQTYVPIGSFSEEGSGDGQMVHPRRSAVENASGNVLVVDRDNGRVQVFSPTADAAEYLAQFGAGTLDEPFGIAIEQSTGDVYVSDPGAEQIFKFNSDGAPTPAYTLDPSFASPPKGAGAGQVGDFEGDLAVDPTSGDLLVADPGDNRVERFEADGSSDSSFTGADSPDGAFTGLLDLDVAPNGDVYVVDSTGRVYVAGGEVGEQGECTQNAYCDAAPSRVLRFDSAGTYQSAVEPLKVDAAGLVTVDPDSSQVIVGRVNPQGVKVRVYSAGGTRAIHQFELPNRFTLFPSMAAGAGRLYAVNDWEPGGLENNAAVAVKVLAALTLPEVSIDPPGTLGTSSVELSGVVNPQGTATEWVFEYRAQGSEHFNQGPSGTLPAGSSSVPVSATLTGLEPNVSYEARLVATNAAELPVASSTVSFLTGGTGPTARTWFTAPRSTTTARVNGLVTPRNAPTTFYFEWGLTAAYGNFAPIGKAAGPGSASTPTLVSQELAGLQPGTTYHFRIVAENAFGKDEGEDRIFTTRTATEMAPPRRGIELVNSPDKGNQNPTGYLTHEGERVVWTTMTGSPGSAQGKGSIFLAERTPTQWSSSSLMPDPETLIGDGELSYTFRSASADYRKIIFQVGEDANFGVSGDPIYYVRYDRVTGQQEQLEYLPAGGFSIDYNDVLWLTSDDGSHFYTTIRDTPEASSVSQLYELGHGSRRLISRLPETGQPPACGTLFDRQRSVMSRDGSRFYFLTRGDNCSDPMRIYLADDRRTAAPGDDTVTRVSTPPTSGPEGDSYPIRVSGSGDALIYYSYGRITAEDTNEAPDIYRWSVGAGNECVTCIVPDPGLELSPYKWSENVKVSPDLSHVYLATGSRLVPGLGAGHAQNLYLFRDSEVRYVSPISSSQGLSLRESGEITPDGRVLTFVSVAPGITTDDNGGLEQAYRYSEDDGSIECLSCLRGGVSSSLVAKPRTLPFLIFVSPPIEAESQTLAYDGSTYVFKTDMALLPRDANGGPDIYEWHNGSIQMITDGEGEFGGTNSVPLSLEGISRDGVDVLFRLSAQLTGHERDRVGQMFVARAGGGFAPPQTPAACVEDACQGPLEVSPPFTQPGSGSLSGAGQAPTTAKPKKRKRAGKKCRLAAKRGKAAKQGKCGKRRGKAPNRSSARNGGGK